MFLIKICPTNLFVTIITSNKESHVKDIRFKHFTNFDAINQSLCVLVVDFGSTMPSTIPVGISSSITGGTCVVLSSGFRFCNPISNTGPYCQAAACVA